MTLRVCGMRQMQVVWKRSLRMISWKGVVTQPINCFLVSWSVGRMVTRTILTQYLRMKGLILRIYLTHLCLKGVYIHFTVLSVRLEHEYTLFTRQVIESVLYTLGGDIGPNF